MSQEERLKLWVFHALNAKGQGVFHCCYAHTEIEARQLQNPWMAARVNEGFETINVWQSPNGFLQSWPGSINENEVDHATTSRH